MSYHGQTQYSKAIEQCQQALSLYDAASDQHGKAHVLNNLGGIYFDLGDAEKAAENYQQALSIFRQFQDSDGEANTLMKLPVFILLVNCTNKPYRYFARVEI